VEDSHLLKEVVEAYLVLITIDRFSFLEQTSEVSVKVAEAAFQ
jgi:hypothetical protein